MTAPQEPLVVSLEEANEMLLDDGWMIRPSGNGTRPWGLVEVTFAPRHDIGLLYTWEEAAEIALGRPVVARDDAAELRAAVNELLASGGARGIERRLQTIGNADGERDRLEAAYARVCALAATEGQP